MSQLIASTKNQIKRLAPYAKDVLVKIERDHELYRSKIVVKVPGAVLHAEKKAQTVWEAVDFSYHAIRKQIDKIKSKRQKKHTPRVWKWQVPARENKNHSEVLTLADSNII